jgi:hypothetical protein
VVSIIAGLMLIAAGVKKKVVKKRGVSDFAPDYL